jgi:hypothetical protein
MDYSGDSSALKNASLRLMRMFDQLHRQLKPGDFVLVNDPPFSEPLPAEIVRCSNNGGLCVKFPDGRQRYFSGREGFADIVAAARKAEGGYVSL